jgi:anti-sigma-K factor RskA
LSNPEDSIRHENKSCRRSPLGAPFPVGVIPAKGSAQIALPDASEKLFFSVSQLAVSFEPTPLKAGDAPSGAFALIGHCVKVW